MCHENFRYYCIPWKRQTGRSGVGTFETSPKYYEGKIGTTNSEIINNMIVNIVENSYGKDYLKMDEDFFEAFHRKEKTIL